MERSELWENIGPTKDEEVLKGMRQRRALGRTRNGPNADPGGAPASSAPLLELDSEPKAMSLAEIDQTEVLWRIKRSMEFGMVRNGELAKFSPAKRGGAWGRKKWV